MNIILDINTLDKNNIFFNNPIKNTVLDNNNSEFIKIIYSNSDIIINGIYLKLNLIYNNVIENGNKFIYVFNIEKNKEAINKINFLENEILLKYNKNFNRILLLKELFAKGAIRIYSDYKIKNKMLFLKISGLWKTNNDIGLTYKIYDINHQ